MDHVPSAAPDDSAALAGSAARDWPPARQPLLIALAVTVVVTVVSHLAPRDWANTAVGAIFLGATYLLVLRGDTETVRAHGLSLGGVTEPERLEPRRLLREGLMALGWALLLAAVFYPPFWLGFRWWWRTGAWSPVLPKDFADLALGQLLVIALPEEAFFRGYLQSQLDGRWSRWRRRVLGAELGPGWLVSAAIFAVGHLLTIPNPQRLAVFFPALLFGWLRARTGGIGAGVLFHAMCNLFSRLLADGYGLG